MVYNSSMKVIELLRKEIRTCGKSRYRISDETGIDKAVLCRIMQGGSGKAETIDILLKYFSYEVRKKKTAKKLRAKK